MAAAHRKPDRAKSDLKDDKSGKMLALLKRDSKIPPPIKLKTFGAEFVNSVVAGLLEREARSNASTQ